MNHQEEIHFASWMLFTIVLQTSRIMINARRLHPTTWRQIMIFDSIAVCCATLAFLAIVTGV